MRLGGGDAVFGPWLRSRCQRRSERGGRAEGEGEEYVKRRQQPSWQSVMRSPEAFMDRPMEPPKASAAIAIPLPMIARINAYSEAVAPDRLWITLTNRLIAALPKPDGVPSSLKGERIPRCSLPLLPRRWGIIPSGQAIFTLDRSRSKAVTK